MVSSFLILINYTILLVLFTKYGTTSATDAKIKVETSTYTPVDIDTISQSSDEQSEADEYGIMMYR
jgi:hypothetical protein